MVLSSTNGCRGWSITGILQKFHLKKTHIPNGVLKTDTLHSRLPTLVSSFRNCQCCYFIPWAYCRWKCFSVCQGSSGSLPFCY
uniref:Uncharacterized protein n=1 Tax=Arundo donax TaxID=35708 RepID=A0A0A9EK42_ARUDO